MYVRKSDLTFIVQDNEHYVGEDGTKWVNTDKDTIKELAKVTEVLQPTGDIVITGFHIDETHTQVWDYREKTSDELAEEKRQSLLNDIISLEAQITNRRMREAIITGDYKFISDIEKQIAEKRKGL